MTDSTSFWSRVAPAQPEYDYASSKALFTTANALPAQWVAAYGGVKPAKQTQIYTDEAPKSIFNGDYQTATASKHARQQGEPAESFLRRMDAHGVTRNVESLTPAERDQIAADIAKAREELDQGQTHEDVRARIGAAEATAGLFGSQMAAAQMRTELDQRTAATTSALRSGVAYEPRSPGVPRVNIAGILQAEEQARGAAVAARYGHGHLRPSGNGLNITAN